MCLFKHDSLYTEDLFGELENEYREGLHMNWVGMYGFNNTYGLVVRREIAEKYNLKTYSDLKSAANSLTFGAEYDFFEREDGYDALCETYGIAVGNKPIQLFKYGFQLRIFLKHFCTDYISANIRRIKIFVIFKNNHVRSR